MVPASFLAKRCTLSYQCHEFITKLVPANLDIQFNKRWSVSCDTMFAFRLTNSRGFRGRMAGCDLDFKKCNKLPQAVEIHNFSVRRLVNWWFT